MPNRERPDDDQVQPVAGEVTTLFGDPVVRGVVHHTQSITPLATIPPAPIRKRRTKGWWKRARDD